MTRVIIVGAGLVGSACAYYCAAAGFEVTVVERGKAAHGTSSRGEGNILVSDKRPGPELELQRLSSRLWEEFAAQRGAGSIEFELKGGIIVAATERSLIALNRYARGQATAGIEAVELDIAALREQEPNISPALAGGVWYPADMQVMPVQAVAEFLRTAKELGARIVPDTAVRGLATNAGRAVGVRTDDGVLGADAVINATGPWARATAQLMGTTIPVDPRRGLVLVTEPLPRTIGHKVYSADYMDNVASPDAGLATSVVIEGTAGGTVLIGASRERVGFEMAIPTDVVRRLAAQAVAVFPFLADVALMRVYRGFRPYTPGNLPLIGPDPSVAGLFHACGHEGEGIGLGPATGFLLAEMLSGRHVDIDVTAFDPTKREANNHAVQL